MSTTSRMAAVGSACLCRASRAFARTVLPLPPQATPAARTAAAALGLADAARAMQPQLSANNGQRGAFPEGAAVVAAAAAAAAAGALVSSSRQEEAGGPVLAAGAYSIPIGRASPEVVSARLRHSCRSVVHMRLHLQPSVRGTLVHFEFVSLLKNEMRIALPH